MIPSEMYGDDLGSILIRYSLVVSTVFQLLCLYLCMMLPDERLEPNQYEKNSKKHLKASYAYDEFSWAYTDSDECSSEQSSPGHRVILRGRRHDKKKRR